MKAQPRILDVLTPDQETTLLEALKREDRRYHIAAIVMLTTGLRVGEVCALKWSDLVDEDTPRDYIELRPDQTKGAKPRTVPVPASTQDAILEYRKRAWYWHRELNGNMPFVKSSRSTDPLSPRDIQRRILAISQRTIKRRVTPHLLRHTYATRMAKVLKIEDLAKLLGHTDLRTTMIYYHPSKEELREAANQARSLKAKPARRVEKRDKARARRKPAPKRQPRSTTRRKPKPRRK